MFHVQKHPLSARASRRLIFLTTTAALFAAACSGAGPSLTDGVTASAAPSVESLSDTEATSTARDIGDSRTQTVTDVTDDGAPFAESDFPPLLTNDREFVVSIVRELGHDPLAFTQGLEFVNGSLYESRGQLGESALTQIDPVTGQVRRAQALNNEIFAEGLTIVEDTAIQLTWRNGIALVYELADFDVIDQFEYDGEGWGLCYDGESLWMSNGSDSLVERDPDTFDVVSSVDVTLDGQAVFNLNELECHGGLVWANVWLTNFLVVIEPTTGEVVARVDASALRQALDPAADAGLLNGIAYDPRIGQMMLTGKYWPTMFVVEFDPCVGSCVPAPFPFTDDN